MNKTVSEKSLTETEIVVVLDRSGSMGSIERATVDGFNTFLKEQQGSEGDGFITLVQFDDRYEVNYKSVPVKEAKDLILHETFVPRGSTALLDAIGKTIEELKTDRDVVFVIITDGHENASRTYKHVAITKMVETQEKEHGWKFIFLAANQDAIKTGGAMGMSAQNSMTYSATDRGASAAFMSFSSNVKSYRKGKLDSINLSDVDLSAVEKSLGFTKEQRDDQK